MSRYFVSVAVIARAEVEADSFEEALDKACDYEIQEDIETSVPAAVTNLETDEQRIISFN